MKAPNFIDLSGKKVGRLTILRPADSRISPSGQKWSYWLCQCDCGIPTIVRGQHLRKGTTKSCGCLLKDSLKKRGSESRNWRGGKTKNEFGYLRFSSGPNKSKLEHHVVMEKFLGREIYPNETVHHKNGIRDDNRLDNLELWASNHPSGQRVSDLVAWAKEILQRYGKD